MRPTFITPLLAALRTLQASEAGQGVAAYGFIPALVAVVVIGALVAIGGRAGSTSKTISGAI